MPLRLELAPHIGVPSRGMPGLEKGCGKFAPSFYVDTSWQTNSYLILPATFDSRPEGARGRLRHHAAEGVRPDR